MFVIFLAALISVLISYTYILNTRLKKFPPGPICLPIIGSLYALGTRADLKLMEMGKKYRSVIAIHFGTQPGIILNDAKAIKEAYNLPAFNGRPYYEFMAHVRKSDGNEGMIFSNGKTGEEQRKFVFDYLRTRRKEKNLFEGVIIDQIKYITKILQAQIGKPIENNDFFNTSAVAPIWTVLTGRAANHNDIKFKSCVDLLTKMVECFSSAGAVYFMPGVCKLFPNITGWNKAADCALQNINFIDSILQTYKSSFSDDQEPQNLIEEYLYKIKNTEDANSNFFGHVGG